MLGLARAGQPSYKPSTRRDMDIRAQMHVARIVTELPIWRLSPRGLISTVIASYLAPVGV